MNSFSQAGQDLFAWHTSKNKRDGTFLDYGCNDPFVHNNTAGLEQIGWVGLCIDIVRFDYSKRKAKFILADGAVGNSQVDKFIEEWEGFIDYLSIDVDDATVNVLKAIPFDRCRFGAITLEHDVYRIGPKVRDWARGFLISKGYQLFREDVRAPIQDGMPWSNQPFEDWYFLPQP